jgi:hypothetical protein
MEIWWATQPLAGTIGEAYLRDVRGIRMPLWPDDLRFHPSCPRHGDQLPAVVALMRDIRTNEPSGIHRTFLTADGSGKDAGASGDMAKMMLGRAKGSVVKLTPDDAVTTGLAIAEGLETAMSCMAIGWPLWACLSAAGIESFPVLPGVESLTIFIDNDKSKVGETAARACAARWLNEGADVRAIRPPQVGADWNDALRAA